MLFLISFMFISIVQYIQQYNSSHFMSRTSINEKVFFVTLICFLGDFKVAVTFLVHSVGLRKVNFENQFHTDKTFDPFYSFWLI